MNTDFDKPPQEVLTQFKELKKALIDASSVIYAHKAGVLDLLQANLDLVTTPDVDTGRTVADTGVTLTAVLLDGNDRSHGSPGGLWGGGSVMNCAIFGRAMSIRQAAQGEP